MKTESRGGFVRFTGPAPRRVIANQNGPHISQ